MLSDSFPPLEHVESETILISGKILLHGYRLSYYLALFLSIIANKLVSQSCLILKLFVFLFLSKCLVFLLNYFLMQ